jgi:hypothetical protein
MGILDGLLGQVTQNVDIKNLAEKVGLSPAQVESAVVALGQAHSAPTDTVDTAATKTGLPTDVLQQIVVHIGGEGALGQFAGLLQGAGMLGKVGGMIDQDGDGNPMDEIAGFAKGLFGKN